MSVANDNHVLFYFKNSYISSLNKIGILLYHVLRNLILSNSKQYQHLKLSDIFKI